MKFFESLHAVVRRPLGSVLRNGWISCILNLLQWCQNIDCGTPARRENYSSRCATKRKQTPTVQWLAVRRYTRRWMWLMRRTLAISSKRSFIVSSQSNCTPSQPWLAWWGYWQPVDCIHRGLRAKQYQFSLGRVQLQKPWCTPTVDNHVKARQR